MRQADGRLRIAVELSDASTGRQLWSERFEGAGQQMFELQDQVVRNIVGALAVKLTSVEQQRVFAKPTDSLEAYDLELRARVLLNRSERISNREARTLLALALSLAPDYAAAHVALGEAEYQRVVYGWVENVDQSIKSGESQAQQALAIDDRGAHASALGLLGKIHSFVGKYDQALADVNRALELNGSDAVAYASRGDVMLWQGRFDEAIASFETAQRFDPQLSTGIFYELVLGYYMAGRYRDAVVLADRSLVKSPDYFELHLVRAMALAELGDVDGARLGASQYRRFSPLFEAASFGSRFAKQADQAKVQRGLGKAGF